MNGRCALDCGPNCSLNPLGRQRIDGKGRFAHSNEAFTNEIVGAAARGVANGHWRGLFALQKISKQL
jgi:hypothetical protein